MPRTTLIVRVNLPGILHVHIAFQLLCLALNTEPTISCRMKVIRAACTLCLALCW